MKGPPVFISSGKKKRNPVREHENKDLRTENTSQQWIKHQCLAGAGGVNKRASRITEGNQTKENTELLLASPMNTKICLLVMNSTCTRRAFYS